MKTNLTDKERKIVDVEYKKHRQDNIPVLLVVAESSLIFHMYFNPKIFKLMTSPISQEIRGRSNGILIRFGRFWRMSHYDEQERELLEYCHSHNINVVDIPEP